MKKQVIFNYTKKYINFIFLFAILVSSISFVKIYNDYKIKQINTFEKVLKNIYLNKTLNTLIDATNPRYENINYKVKKGENFASILDKLEVPVNEKKIVLAKLAKKNKYFKIYENQKIYFKIDRKKPIKIEEINFSLSRSKNLVFYRIKDNNDFTLKEIQKNLKKVLSYKESSIISSLYSSAIIQKIPPNVIVDFARIYGFQIDFQRDIWKNDRFQIIFENYLNEKNESIETGNILYANLILKGKEHPLYFFKTEDLSDHYDETGQSIRKTLMKTPINGARLSSKFGKRKHPILGFTKMHTGTDFAAPKGTPIMASGDGIVTKASWCGGGGNCVKIKHNSTYTTVYAHMSKFGRSIKKGTKVRQGQIIGYVGSTGMSTGPHLHYEVIENGRKINSQTLKLPSGKILKGNERKKFEIVKIKTNVLKSNLIQTIN